MGDGAGLTIRAATPSDAAHVAELLGHLGYPAGATDVARRLAALDDAGDAVLLAVRGDRPVGLVGMHAFRVVHADGAVAYITALVIHPAAQRAGVGRALVQAAEAWARERGCSRLTVTSAEHREGAHAFYPGVGMEYTGRRYSRAL